LLDMKYVLGIRSFLSFSNLDSFQNSTIEQHCTHACSRVARSSVLTSYCREDEPVSPTQTILLKLLDSFLNPVPTPFRGRHDHLNNLTDLLASVFLFQAKHAQHVIQNATGEPPPGENIVTDVGVSESYALDGRLPGVWVALVLLSTILSSILLAEQEDDSGANADPGVVTLTHLCHDAISASQSPTGSGFIEELVGMMVPRSAPYLLQRQAFIQSQKPCVCSTSFSHVLILGGRSGHPRRGEKLPSVFLATKRRQILPTFLTSNETW
jgi:hypothetical protein